ncbi:hypothetical protein Tco_0670571 [Tanacetum coccineum]
MEKRDSRPRSDVGEGINRTEEHQAPRHATNVEEGINLLSTRNSFEAVLKEDNSLDGVDPSDMKPFDDNDPFEDDEDEVEEVYHEPFLDKSCIAKHNEVFKNWQWTSNGLLCVKGSRIILGWNLKIINVVVISFDDQNLETHKGYIQNKPWCVFGDFNVSLHDDEKSTDTSYIDMGMRNFQACVDAIKGNIHATVDTLRHELDEAQKALDSDPDNADLREEEAAYLHAFTDVILMQEQFLMQKAKVEWLKLRDANTAYFYKVEIREAIFAIRDNKSPGLDGYSTAFFKEAWDIIADDVYKAIKEFFTNGVLLKELNHTIIALIPKVSAPMIITNRMKDSLTSLVSLNQSAFVPGRRISDNILLTQELMHNYHLDRGTPRCAFKVDIQKAYDTVDWNFLHEVLIGFGFHPRMIGWIMECVASTSFSLSINGSLHGYFKGKRGLRQDDLFLFAHGDVNSARVIMDTLEEFKNTSGLTPSLSKSRLTVKYLGVPLVPSRLLYRDCTELMEKVKRRIGDWKNKSLSLAGRA